MSDLETMVLMLIRANEGFSLSHTDEMQLITRDVDGGTLVDSFKDGVYQATVVE